jgi:hypothetical protein
VLASGMDESRSSSAVEALVPTAPGLASLSVGFTVWQVVSTWEPTGPDCSRLP